MLSNEIVVLTEDLKQIKLSKQICEISELFKTLLINYNIDKKEKLKNVNSKDLTLLIEFCENLGYKPISFEKPLWKHSVEYHLNSLPEEAQKFYKDKLNPNNIIQYFFIASYYDVSSLDELIYLKLSEVFSSEEQIKKYFQNENENLDEELKINEERENFLREKYQFYVNSQLESLKESEIDDLCKKYYQ